MRRAVSAHSRFHHHRLQIDLMIHLMIPIWHFCMMLHADDLVAGAAKMCLDSFMESVQQLAAAASKDSSKDAKDKGRQQVR